MTVVLCNDTKNAAAFNMHYCTFEYAQDCCRLKVHKKTRATKYLLNKPNECIYLLLHENTPANMFCQFHIAFIQYNINQHKYNVHKFAKTTTFALKHNFCINVT